VAQYVTTFPASPNATLAAMVAGNVDAEDIAAEGHRLLAHSNRTRNPQFAAKSTPEALAAQQQEHMMEQIRNKTRTLLEQKFRHRMLKTVAERVDRMVPDELALAVAKAFPKFFYQFKQLHNTGLIWGRELAAARRHAMSLLQQKLIGQVHANVTREVEREEQRNMEDALDTAVDAKVELIAQIMNAESKLVHHTPSEEDALDVVSDSSPEEKSEPSTSSLLQDQNEVFMLQEFLDTHEDETQHDQ
jgi:hypothetical protein